MSVLTALFSGGGLAEGGKRGKHTAGGATMNTKLLELEEMIAHLSRVVDDLSDVVARQEREIDTLRRRMVLLMEREAEREAGESSSIPLADQKPPHW